LTVFGCADGEIMKKIKYLRCQYMEQMKKEKKSRSAMGVDEVYVSKWKFYHSLGFLADYINYAGKHLTTSNRLKYATVLSYSCYYYTASKP